MQIEDYCQKVDTYHCLLNDANGSNNISFDTFSLSVLISICLSTHYILFFFYLSHIYNKFIINIHSSKLNSVHFKLNLVVEVTPYINCSIILRKLDRLCHPMIFTLFFYVYRLNKYTGFMFG